jgi:DedD protein
MDKKATRRIIGVLVVIALVIILLPLFNTNETQSNVQTAEIKAPPFPDTQNQIDSSDTIATANNETKQDPAKAGGWLSKVTNSPEQPTTKPAPPVVVAQNTATSPTQQFVNNNNNANSGTITPPKQDTMIANSTLDGEEEIEQEPNAPINNVTISNNDAPAATTNPPTTLSVPPIAPPPNTTEPALPAPTAAKQPDDKSAAKTPVTVITPVPAKSASAPKPAVIAATPNAKPASQAPVVAVQKPAPLKTPVVAENKPLKTPAEESAKPVPLKTPVVATVTPATTPAKTSVQTADAKLSHDLNQLKKTAWVVQMGSFRSKVNAERLTNALRAKGYKAFTYETKSNGQTRVYIGPEFKQGNAALVASRIQSDMKMHGIIISYQPLEL